jgi:hypothetical protein
MPKAMIRVSNTRRSQHTYQSIYRYVDEEVSVVPRLFRLAETVGEQSFKNVNEARKLKERISRRIQPGSRPMTPDVESRKEQRVEKQQVM